MVVMDAAVRSWAPLDPLCLRWRFPLWTPAPELDPSLLRKDNRRKRQEKRQQPPREPEPTWDVDTFVDRFVSERPRTKDGIVVAARGAKVSERLAAQLLSAAEEEGKAHRWHYGSRKPIKFATIEQPVTATAEGVGR